MPAIVAISTRNLTASSLSINVGAVSGMILRGTFLARREDLAWFFGAEGTARLFPDAYEDLRQAVPSAGHHDLIRAYHRHVHGDDPEVAFEWAQTWSRWADRIATWTLQPPAEQGEPDRQRLVAKARIETHYAVNGYFLGDRPLLDGMRRLPDVPITIVQGRRDLVCPVEAAWTLHRAIAGSRLILLSDAGHLAVEPAMIDALVEETNRFRERCAVRSLRRRLV